MLHSYFNIQFNEISPYLFVLYIYIYMFQVQPNIFLVYRSNEYNTSNNEVSPYFYIFFIYVSSSTKYFTNF